MVKRAVNVGKHTFRSNKLRSIVKVAAEFFAATPTHQLPPAESFEGVGVYALFYRGDFELYRPIAHANASSCTRPIYVGKAVPPGWRTARTSQVKVVRGLFGRLREHSHTVAQVGNLEPIDFLCQFMILDNIEMDLITAVEANLIRLHTPLWNTVVDGFGNHDPGSGRYDQAKSEWDVLHPGRPWADRLKGKAPASAAVRGKVKAALLS